MVKIYVKEINNCSQCGHIQKSWDNLFCKLSKKHIITSKYGVRDIQRQDIPGWCKLDDVIK